MVDQCHSSTYVMGYTMLRTPVTASSGPKGLRLAMIWRLIPRTQWNDLLIFIYTILAYIYVYQ